MEEDREEKAEEPVDAQHQEENTDDLLLAAKVPAKIKKRGRPKGSMTTAIGLPRNQRQKTENTSVPFFRKAIRSRTIFILKLFLEDVKVESALNGQQIDESEIEMIPKNIPGSIMDANIDVKLVKKYFTEEGFAALTGVISTRRMPWRCEVCLTDLATKESVGCECCLNWYHFE